MLRRSFPAKQATGSGEILSATAQRLVRWGMLEREAYALAQIINLHAETPDKTVEQAVIYALVSAKEAADGHTPRNIGTAEASPPQTWGDLASRRVERLQFSWRVF